MWGKIVDTLLYEKPSDGTYGKPTGPDPFNSIIYIPRIEIKKQINPKKHNLVLIQKNIKQAVKA